MIVDILSNLQHVRQTYMRINWKRWNGDYIYSKFLVRIKKIRGEMVTNAHLSKPL